MIDYSYYCCITAGVIEYYSSLLVDDIAPRNNEAKFNRGWSLASVYEGESTTLHYR